MKQERYNQIVNALTKQQISLGRYQKIIKDIKDIQLMGIIEAVKDENVLEQICKFQQLEHAKLELIYKDLKEIKRQKENYIAIIDAIKKVEPLDLSELFG